MSLPSIFISYRRSDSAAFAGRVQDEILRAIPDAKVFLDVNTIDKGDNFRTAITSSIEASEVFLILIGKGWLTLDKTSGTPRVCNDGDYVRYEISWALKHKKTIIPVLIDGAMMPEANLLPEDIRDLTFHNAAEIRHSRFNDDMNSLLRDLGGIFSVDLATENESVSSFKALLGLGVGVILGLLCLTLILSIFDAKGIHASEYIGNVGSTLLIPIAAILGGYFGYQFQKRK
jgi:hypothetical protein